MRGAVGWGLVVQSSICMPVVFAAYIPSWSGAIAQLPGQFALIGLLAAAIYAFAVHRQKYAIVLFALMLGLIGGIVGGLSFAWATHGFRESTTIAFFELNRLQAAGFIGLVASWLLLEAISYGHKVACQTQSRRESN